MSAKVWKRRRARKRRLAIHRSLALFGPPLFPWQEPFVDAVLSGQQLVFIVPRKSGRSAAERFLEAAGWTIIRPERKP